MRIATRSSKLALKQVDIFTNNFKTQDIDFEIKKQITEGDKKSKKGENLFDKAHFVEDLEESLLNNEADIAIHSLKDMSCHDTRGLEIYAAIEHPSRSDVLIYKDKDTRDDADKEQSMRISNRHVDHFKIDYSLDATDNPIKLAYADLKTNSQLSNVKDA